MSSVVPRGNPTPSPGDETQERCEHGLDVFGLYGNGAGELPECAFAWAREGVAPRPGRRGLDRLAGLLEDLAELPSPAFDLSRGTASRILTLAMLGSWSRTACTPMRCRAELDDGTNDGDHDEPSAVGRCRPGYLSGATARRYRAEFIFGLPDSTSGADARTAFTESRSIARRHTGKVFVCDRGGIVTKRTSVAENDISVRFVQSGLAPEACQAPLRWQRLGRHRRTGLGRSAARRDARSRRPPRRVQSHR